jgi:predicted RNase H-like nuclease
VSLVDCTTYVRHRDIWDLHWLRQQGATMNPELVRKKLADYRSAQYPANALALIERLPRIIEGKEFKDQMSRFIPSGVQERTLLKDKFLTLLVNETTRALKASALAASTSA